MANKKKSYIETISIDVGVFLKRWNFSLKLVFEFLTYYTNISLTFLFFIVKLLT